MLRSAFKSYFSLAGWTIDTAPIEAHPRCVVTAAPHTTNMDFVYTIGAFEKIGLPMKFAIKKEILRPPLNWAIEPLGAIAIDRSPRREGENRPSLVQSMIRVFEDNEGPLALVIAPEGSRSLRQRWRTGFYHVAVGANVPILLGYLDYKDKRAGIGEVIQPSGDIDADMRKIMEFYADIEPYDPSKFMLDERWAPRAD